MNTSTCGAALERMTYAKEQRLRLIDFLLLHYGHINRAALMDYFAISEPQASRDIADYLAIAPTNVAYNKSSKRYVVTPEFVRVFS